jgi:hypothetical protein
MTLTLNSVRLCCLVAALLLGPLASLHADEPVEKGIELNVSPTGDDANPGTREKPLATIAAAQRAARPFAGHKPVTVFLHAGNYYLPDTVRFTAADSGSEKTPVVYAAAPGEQPVISGGTRLNLDWTPVRDGRFQAKTPAGLMMDQLFLNGQRQHMARYPNYDPNARQFNGSAADAIAPERVARWHDPAGGYVHAMHNALWGDMHWRILGKKADGSLAYEGGWQNNRPSAMHKQFRFVENIREELDAPGEWFYDAKSEILLFYPPPGVDLKTATVEVVRLRHLIEFNGTKEKPVKFITLRGLTLRHAARTFMENREPLLRSDWTVYRGGALVCNGDEHVAIENCSFDQLGGNAVFVDNYNRHVTVRGCLIRECGANGVAFVGSPKAVRNPLFNYNQKLDAAKLDRTPGPLTDDFPADCLVENCLITRTGRFEKQTAPVEIDMAQGITVRHCSIYDVPRAGINIGDGCWGGHVIEFCDVFDTVKETGDHGSFNSWGRDRYWRLQGLDLNNDKTWEAEQQLPVLDAVKTVILRNNRWRCDHGWDIDLDDGSSNYHIYNNLCLRGGLKNREGFFRIVENNIIVNNGFHPHVWYKHSQDVVRRNILGTDRYLPAGGMPSAPWGSEMDYNLIHRPGATIPQTATKLAQQSQRDAHSIVADALFVDPEHGDFRVKDDSPALKLGFVNFPMDRFGVQNPELKAIARTPDMPTVQDSGTSGAVAVHYWLGLKVKDLEGEEYSAYGVSKESGGVQVLSGTNSGIAAGDLIQSLNGQPVTVFAQLMRLQNEAAGKPLDVGIVRKQQQKTVRVTAYVFMVMEAGTPTADGVPIQAITTRPATHNDPVATLHDGRFAERYGPVFGNETVGGAYKVDLGNVIDIARIKTWSFNQNKSRGAQRFVLFGGATTDDPGWDASKFTPIIEVDTTHVPVDKFSGTCVRSSAGQSVGAYRWLMWVVYPVTEIGENTAFQEFQVVAMP